ncbi:MAG TPA: nitroreductase family protein [Desulfomicrobiaceae bacterium]|nr:nitroreductase family protein [Desulfomicrobiaceae bacterium]
MFRDLVLKTRTYRRFYERSPVSMETLKDLTGTARLTASAGNLQPLCYILSSNPETNEVVFRHLRWAAYLKDWDGPREGERPAAYIIMLGDTSRGKDFAWDQGIAAQTIMLAAAEIGLGGCMMGSVDKQGLRRDLDIPDRYEILLILAIGRPKEMVVLEQLEETKDIRYYRDSQGHLHVPKRRLGDVILKKFR